MMTRQTKRGSVGGRRTVGPVAARAGMSLVETVIATAVASAIMMVVVLATSSFRKTFEASERLTRAQAVQWRMIDHVGTDLRRSTRVGITTAPFPGTPDAGGNVNRKFVYSAVAPSTNFKTIRDGSYHSYYDRPNGARAPSTFLTLRVPGFYQSNDKADANFRSPMPLVTDGRYVFYGTQAAASPDVIVEYRKAYLAAYGSECFIRREAGVDTVVAEKCNQIELDITALPSSTFLIETWFTPSFSSLGVRTPARLTSSDQVMLRNPRKD